MGAYNNTETIKKTYNWITRSFKIASHPTKAGIYVYVMCAPFGSLMLVLQGRLFSYIYIYIEEYIKAGWLGLVQNRYAKVAGLSEADNQRVHCGPDGRRWRCGLSAFDGIRGKKMDCGRMLRADGGVINDFQCADFPFPNLFLRNGVEPNNDYSRLFG